MEELFETEKAIELAETSRTAFFKAVKKLQMKGKKPPKSRKVFYNMAQIKQIKSHVYNRYDLVESPKVQIPLTTGSA